MGPDVEKYSQGTYAEAAPHTDSSSLAPELNIDYITETVTASRDNAWLPPLTGIKVVADPNMNPHDCKFVVGMEFFKRMKEAIDYENSKTEE